MASQCYNRGCGKTFEPSENEEGACSYHPGRAIFHDALKGWSCCKKRTCDFSEFLGIPGCSHGRHNSEKPVEEARGEEEEAEEARDGVEVTVRGGESAQPTSMPAPRKELIFRGPPPAKNKAPRPSGDAPLSALPVTVSAALQRALEEAGAARAAAAHATNGDSGVALVKVGTSCKNGGCKATYRDGVSSNTEPCIHHPGVPVFHEGMKFWSCCERRTTEFSSFLAQVGCSHGTHRWVDSTQEKRCAECRFDWHQTARDVVLSIYARDAQPLLSSAHANPTTLEVTLVFDEGKKFVRRFQLYGTVDVEHCTMGMAPTKVEVALRKAEAYHWANLEHPSANQSTAGAEQPYSRTKTDNVKPGGEPAREPAVPAWGNADGERERERLDDGGGGGDGERDDDDNESLGLSDDDYDSEWEREFGEKSGDAAPEASEAPTTPTAPTLPTLPTAPTAPTLPTLPTAPTAPAPPTPPTAPTAPTAPTLPTLPTAPTAPTAPAPPTEWAHDGAPDPEGDFGELPELED
ncbi:cysteine and histidine-rich domain-containing protein 1-like [Lampetra fluviatilis]